MIRGPPMWTNEKSSECERDHLRYPSDLTEEELAYVEPLIPPARRGGRRRETDTREALAMMYVLSTGCQWRYLPEDLPPRSTVYRYLRDWALMACSIASMTRSTKTVASRPNAEPAQTAAIIDSQSVKGAERGGLDRSARVRRGKEDQGQEASPSRRHPAADAGHRSFRRCPGPRRQHFVDTMAGSPVSKTVRRQRLSEADLR